MVNLAKRSLSLLILSTVLLIAEVSLAGEQDFYLTFSSGSIYTVKSNSVVSGDHDRYYFNAQADQRISLAITSNEDNAVIQLLYKQGEEWLAVPGTEVEPDIKVWYGVLPSSESNQYRIDVSGTRGNTSYDLFVGIAAVSR